MCFIVLLSLAWVLTVTPPFPAFRAESFEDVAVFSLREQKAVFTPTVPLGLLPFFLWSGVLSILSVMDNSPPTKGVSISLYGAGLWLSGKDE